METVQRTTAPRILSGTLPDTRFSIFPELQRTDTRNAMRDLQETWRREMSDRHVCDRDLRDYGHGTGRPHHWMETDLCEWASADCHKPHHPRISDRTCKGTCGETGTQIDHTPIHEPLIQDLSAAIRYP